MKTDIDYESPESAFTKALSLLQIRERSVFELKNRLIALGFDTCAVSEAIDRLIELNLLNDARFLEAYILGKERKGWSRAKIEHELRMSHGIEAFEFASYPDAFYQVTDEVQRCLNLLTQKFQFTPFEYRKGARFLSSKGYKSEYIFRALDQFQNK